MATNKKRHDEILATLTPEARQLCEQYAHAKDAEKEVVQAYRTAMAAKQHAQRISWKLAEQIEKPALEATVGSIVYNLRNGRLYEVADVKGNYYTYYYHLNPKTGYTHGRYTTGRYTTYAWGPKLLLPESHPFVQKRISARLAERLKGEGD